jgi:hypothetical protein
MVEISQKYDTLPLIQTAAEKATLSPLLDERIYYLPANRIERWDGSVWVGDTQNPAVMIVPNPAFVYPDADAASFFQITATNGDAFTVHAPTNPHNGYIIGFDIENDSGGSMGTITWDSVFKLAGAFTNPADGYRRTITFYYDGTNWIELKRAEADI